MVRTILISILQISKMSHNHTIQAKFYVKSLLSCMCPSGGTQVPHAQYSQIESSCPRYHNATSTCQKCSATVFCIGNQLWSIFPAIFLNGCKSLEKSTFFFIPTCMLHLPQAASKWLPVTPALWKLSSSLFLFQPKPLQVPHLNKSHSVKGK